MKTKPQEDTNDYSGAEVARLSQEIDCLLGKMTMDLVYEGKGATESALLVYAAISRVFHYGRVVLKGLGDIDDKVLSGIDEREKRRAEDPTI